MKSRWEKAVPVIYAKMGKQIMYSFTNPQRHSLPVIS